MLQHIPILAACTAAGQQSVITSVGRNGGVIMSHIIKKQDLAEVGLNHGGNRRRHFTEQQTDVFQMNLEKLTHPLIL